MLPSGTCGRICPRLLRNLHLTLCLLQEVTSKNVTDITTEIFQFDTDVIVYWLDEGRWTSPGLFKKWWMKMKVKAEYDEVAITGSNDNE